MNPLCFSEQRGVRVFWGSVNSNIGLLTQEKTQFEAVKEMADDPEYFKTALGIVRAIPSAETLRQRMDDIGDSRREDILKANINMFTTHRVKPDSLCQPY